MSRAIGMKPKAYSHPARLLLFLSLIMTILPLNCAIHEGSLKSQTERKSSRQPSSNPEITEAPPIPLTHQRPYSRREPLSPHSDLDLAPDHKRIAAAVLARMSVEQRIAQRFMTWIPGTKPTRQTISVVERGNLGGILLNSFNIESRSQISELIDEMQALAFKANPPIGLFIGVDQEGGRVSRFVLRGITRFPAPYYLGEHRDEELMRSVAYIIGTEIRALGCNMNLAPVLDLYGRPDRSIIGDRSMGNDPQIVGRLGLQYLLGAKRAGVIAVIKHFPGQGVTTVDSHKKLPVVPAKDQKLVELGIEPFRVAIENGAEAVMTAHVLYEGLDPQFPCTLSRRIIQGVLREEMGFEGIVLSDAIEMGAIRNNYDIREIIRLCIKAGVDLVLVNGIFSIQDLINTTLALLEAGAITVDEIDSGAERILRIKAKYGLLHG